MNNISFTDKWHLNKDDLSSLKLAKYYLIHWSNGYFIDHYDSINNKLYHQGLDYYVQFHACTMQDIATNDIVKLSFRKRSNLDTGVVLVTPDYKNTNTRLVNKEVKYNPSGNWRAPLPKKEEYPELIVIGDYVRLGISGLKCFEKDKLSPYQLANIVKKKDSNE